MITSLKISGFRNINTASLIFEKGINLFTGPNGSGKTNLLEAISLFSLGKSCRGAKDREMVGFSREMAEVVAVIGSEKKNPKSQLE